MQPVGECEKQKTIYPIQMTSMADKITNTIVPIVESLWPISEKALTLFVG